MHARAFRQWRQADVQCTTRIFAALGWAAAGSGRLSFWARYRLQEMTQEDSCQQKGKSMPDMTP